MGFLERAGVQAVPVHSVVLTFRAGVNTVPLADDRPGRAIEREKEGGSWTNFGKLPPSRCLAGSRVPWRWWKNDGVTDERHHVTRFYQQAVDLAVPEPFI